MRFSLIIVPAALGLCPATASAQDKPKTDWFSRVQVAAKGYYTDAWEGPWLSSADMPADLKNGPFSSSSNLSIEIDKQGKPTGCAALKASIDARLDAIACRKLMQNPAFSTMYEAPGRPIAYKLNIVVNWSTFSRAALEEQRRQSGPKVIPVPGWPAGDFRGWPRLKWDGGLQIDRFPDLQSLRPAGARQPATATTSLDLLVERDKGIVGCTIGISSGNAALDEAACTVAKALPLSYPEPCSTAWCGDQSLPLQFVWLKEGSHIRVPLSFQQRKPMPRDPADTGPIKVVIPRRTEPPISVDAKDFADIADKSIPNPRVFYQLSIDRDGKVTGCYMGIPSGNRAVDARFCAIISKARYGLMTDAFGDYVANKQSGIANLSGVF